MSDRLERKSDILDEENHRDSQFNAHNTPPANAKRIRMSWLVIVLLFVALALTAVLISTRSY